MHSNTKGKFEIFVGTDKQYYFRLKAPNGEIIGWSEGYTQKHNAKNGTESVRTNSQVDSRFTIFLGNDDQYYFNLKSVSGAIILQSEGYKTRQGATNGEDSVSKYAPDATFIDLTAQAA